MNYQNGAAMYIFFIFLKVSSNFDNGGDRHFEKEKVAGLTYKKPLMYFCFDVMEGVEKTIALTCPHKTLTTATALAKCCPKGIVYIYIRTIRPYFFL